MPKDHPLTYRGALRILGSDDPSWLKAVDRALGGVILAAPAVALFGPAGVAAAVWGAVDQKNQAFTLIQDTLRAVSQRRLKTAGYERRKLVAAAHTVLVVTSFFESLRERLGNAVFDALALTTDEQVGMASGWDRGQGEKLVDKLYAVDVPAPSATRGFEENVVVVQGWLVELADRVVSYLELLAAWHGGVDFEEVVKTATVKYREHYLRMASDVPEFLMWASFGEHAATRAEVCDTRHALAAALDHHGAALIRIERLLSLDPPAVQSVLPDSRVTIHQANTSVLNLSIVPDSRPGHRDGAEFPTVGQIYVNPRYRISGGEMPEVKPWDEKWWRDRSVRDDLDMLLATHLTSADGAEWPLLLLGHPGAGKSMLMKVLAARLPVSEYTVVRVPLRRVDVDAPVYDQVEQALSATTHGRVTWPTLVEQSKSTVRVVLLDGLDELLQASSNRRMGYLQEVVDFQRREAGMDRPVVVIVTSRTVVADRVTIPERSPVVRLEEFDETEVAAWLDIWNEVNRAGARAGTFRPLDVETAMTHPDLVEQPLLLFMLALHSADPNSVSLDADLSKAALYGHLLESFARREVTRPFGNRSEEDFEEAVEDQMWRLGIVALGMFNRGRHDITEVELEQDARAFAEGDSREATASKWTIGQFFFVHLAETNEHVQRLSEKSYEFLHATFGEYLVARHLLGVVIQQLPSGGRRRDRNHDDLMFAAMSHQPLSNRRTVLTFLQELVGALPQAQQDSIIRMLRELLPQHRKRNRSDRFADYRPLPTDHVRELAAYSANLVLLRLVFAPDGMPLDQLWSSDDNQVQWRSMVELWRAGLDGASWQDLVSSLGRHVDLILLGLEDIHEAVVADVSHARLTGDIDLVRRLRYGFAVNDSILTWARFDGPKENVDLLISGALDSSIPGRMVNLVLPDEVEESQTWNRAVEIIGRVLKDRGSRLPYEAIDLIIGWGLGSVPKARFGLQVLRELVVMHPKLLEKYPDLLEDCPAPKVADNGPVGELGYVITVLNEDQIHSSGRGSVIPVEIATRDSPVQPIVLSEALEPPPGPEGAAGR
ncbi:NACHT domain-containing protein [Umezawaea tangerina]|uniref:ATPase family protein associated with various cellular activities (AAA) n=1 Tax=Umezawaea tangerina TaxID=84725 RepID=A0A2T0THP4_9PSEU|nr:AAA family ATPase [Umezawaea tangerina]PRY45224.1 ATPase family protein associated with various cellular activities (AAA) [Umezawaea tangerina]